jgi:hypothetical protein
MKRFFVLAALATATLAFGDYRTTLFRAGLQSPTGIAVSGGGNGVKVYVTQNPSPGVPGSMGGNNSIDVILANGWLLNLHRGEPDPVNIALGPGSNLYWTCRSAGVILERRPNGAVAPLLTGLDRPNGIALDRWNNVYFTQIPTPGVPGSMGGMNTVNVYDGNAVHLLTFGEPEPTDIAWDPRSGSVFWTCKSAGVILERTRHGAVSLFLGGLSKPTGIDIDQHGNMFFTEVPTPGVPGSAGGGNFIWKVDLETKARSVVHFGDPEPTDVAVARDGSVFWTCTSAGVILRAVERR